MWQGPRKSRQKCTMDDLSPQQPQQQQQQHCLDILHQNLDVQATIATTPTTTTRTCGHDFIPLTILPHVRRAHLQFPPPPNYPPPHHPSTSKMSSSPLPQSEEHPLGGNNCMPGPSTQQQQQTWEMPTDYSYAYYVPGPPTRHTNVPSKYPGTYREGSYRSRHTYLTRYGTEENIYEEISEFERARLRPQHHHYHHHHHHHNLHQDSVMSINQSLVEEEVRRIQSGHRRVLGELNLSVEAMLMPQSSSSSREGSEDTDRENETDDQLADLLTIGPTDDLLSPVPLVDLDSGFSGSSSGASYRSSTTSSLRRCTGTTCAISSVSSGASGVQERPKSTISLMKTPPQNITLTTTPSGSKGFWGKKAWKKLTGFPSTISLNKQKVADHGNN